MRNLCGGTDGHDECQRGCPRSQPESTANYAEPTSLNPQQLHEKEVTRTADDTIDFPFSSGHNASGRIISFFPPIQHDHVILPAINPFTQSSPSIECVCVCVCEYFQSQFGQEVVGQLFLSLTTFLRCWCNESVLD